MTDSGTSTTLALPQAPRRHEPISTKLTST